MDAYFSPRHIVTMLAALILAVVLTFMPNASAFAQEDGQKDGKQTGVIEISYQDAAPEDPVLLRHLLSSPQLDNAQRLLLERAMDGVYEELADATPAQPSNKGFIQSVNDLLGVKSGDAQAHAKG